MLHPLAKVLLSSGAHNLFAQLDCDEKDWEHTGSIVFICETRQNSYDLNFFKLNNNRLKSVDKIKISYLPKLKHLDLQSNLL